MDPLDRPESPGPRQDALPGGQIELTMPPDDDSAPGTVPPAPRRYTALAWGVIIVLCAVMVLIHQGRQEAPAPGESDEDTLGLMLMEMQAKYIIYTAHLQGGGDLLYQSAVQIDTGTIGQRRDSWCWPAS